MEILAVLVLVSIPLVIGLLRINELFCLELRAGKLRVRRGRIPQGLLDDIRDVLSKAQVGDIELRGVIEDGRAQLRPRGVELPASVRQRLRNTIALWPLAKIRSAPKKRRR